MDNRPVGREKRVLSGGSGIRRSGEGLGKTVSERGIKQGAGELKKVIRKVEGKKDGRK